MRSAGFSSVVWLWLAGLAGGVYWGPLAAQAQIVPDQTLGTESSVVTPGTLNGLPTDLINGGAIRDANLFHSFQEFNVQELQRVYFSNPQGIINILSRVTGNDPSNIFGTLGVDGPASLYLINPNGIIFGPNAQLDVNGSFLASTSDRFIFVDGSEFRATNPNQAPLVTVSVAPGIQFGPDTPKPIFSEANLTAGGNLVLAAGEVTSSGILAAPNGIAMVSGVSGDVTVNAVAADTALLAAHDNLVLNQSQLVTNNSLYLLAEDTVVIRDSESSPFIAQAGGDLYIQGNEGIDILALNHQNYPIYAGGALTLVSDGIVSGDAHFESGGNYSILNRAGEPGTFVSLYDPIIRAQGNVAFGDYTGPALMVEATGGITGGNIRITGADTSLDASRATAADLERLTQRPSLILRAGVDPTTPENAPFWNAPELGNGNNSITVGTAPDETQFFLVGANTYIFGNNTANTINVGPNNSTEVTGLGDDSISAAIPLPFTFSFFGTDYNEVYVSSNGFLTFDAASPSGCCTGGLIPSPQGPNNLIAGWWEDLDPPEGGAIRYRTVGNPGNQRFAIEFENIQHFPSGTPVTFQFQLLENGNNIDVHYINALSDGGIHSAGVEDATGTAGLQFQYGTSSIATDTAVRYTPTSNAGSNSISIGSVDTSVRPVDDANFSDGGDVILEAIGDITIRGDIDTSAAGANGGDVAISSSAGSIFVEGSDVTTNTFSPKFSSGQVVDAGNITLSAATDIQLTNSTLDAGALSARGNGGNIALTILDNPAIEQRIILDNTQLFSDTLSIDSSDQGGNIALTADTISLSDRSLVDASTNGAGTGGSIAVNANVGGLSLSGESAIQSQVGPGADGRGGDVTISASSIAMQEGSRLSARTLGEGSPGAGDIQIIVTGADTTDPGTGATIPAFTITSALCAIADCTPSGFSSGIFTSSETAQGGAGGSININFTGNGSLRLSDGAVLSTLNRSTSAGGDIVIGNLNQPTNVEVINGAQLVAASLGDNDPNTTDGEAGRISINALGTVLFSGSDASFSTRPALVIPTFSGTGTLPEDTNNDSITARQVVFDSSNDQTILSLTSTPDIRGSTLIPHVSIGQTVDSETDDSFDYFEFEVTEANTIGTFDIDFGSGSGGSVDTELFLFEVSLDKDGNEVTTLLARNDDFSTLAGGGGSTSGLDSYLAYRFLDPGRYIIGVGRFNSTADDAGIIAATSAPILTDNTYTLQLGLTSTALFNEGLRPNQGDTSGIFSGTLGSGSAGEINIAANDIQLTAAARIDSSTQSSGDSGVVTLNASDQVVLADGSRIDNNTFGTGSSQNITIGTGTLILSDGSQIRTDSYSSGTGGSIDIAASNGVFISGSRPNTPILGSVTQSNIIALSSGDFSSCAAGADCTPNIASANSAQVTQYASRSQAGSNGFVYYTFGVAEGGTRGLFDIDFGSGSGEFIDAELFLFDQTGQLLASNDDSSPTSGAGGSTSFLDSFIDYNFPTAGTYILGVGAYDSFPSGDPGNPIDGDFPTAASTYELQFSLEEVSNPTALSDLQDAEINSGISARSLADGAGGSVSISTGYLELTDNAEITATTLGLAQGGDISITVPGSAGSLTTNGVRLENSTITAAILENANNTAADIPASNIAIRAEAGSVSLSNSLVSAETAGPDRGGNILVSTSPGGSVILDGVYVPTSGREQIGGLVSRSTAGSDAGTVTVNTGQLAVSNNAQITASSEAINGVSQGIAGTVDITARDIALNRALISATNEAAAQSGTVDVDGDGTNDAFGNIELQGVSTVSATNSLIAASTDSGFAGSISINEGTAPAERIEFIGTFGVFDGQTVGGLVAAGRQGGSAGSVLINASYLGLQDQAIAAVSATGDGSAGDLTVLGSTVSLNNQAGLVATTENGAGGSIELQQLNNLLVNNNSRIEASTSTGVAGSVQIGDSGSPADNILIAGSSDISVSANGSKARAGDIAINGRNVLVQSAPASDNFSFASYDFRGALLQVLSGGIGSVPQTDSDRSRIRVDNPSGVAGSLEITADYLGLSGGVLQATSGLSGNNAATITIDLSRDPALGNFLALANESLIEANALNDASGGNINITADLVFGAFPTGSSGSDIIANATEGRGGNIAINTLVIFGLEFRDFLTPLNDITANSLSGEAGTVQITTLGIDPSRGLSEVPLAFVDATDLVGDRCAPVSGEASQFTVAGRGGIPTNPTQPLSPTLDTSDWVTLNDLEPVALEPDQFTPVDLQLSSGQCLRAWRVATGK